ncbi:MAG: hypothetical protein IJ661_05810 [Lachnospiraceae bacterium]|nr:hypothetical protein [Lachnospiraceae bacterium]
MERYYIFRYYSNWGMGSDSETALLSEEYLRRIIELELIKKESGSDRYDDRMTGTWSDEVFCDSKDKDEVIADVIKKRLNTCSTYAGVNDLIALSEDMVIETRKEALEKVIFRLFNQFGFRRDVIAGCADFKHNIVDFNDEYERYGINMRYVDFVSYSMKNAAENPYFYDLESFLTVNRDKAIRMRKKLESFNEGKADDTGDVYEANGRYFYEIAGIEDIEYYKHHLESAERMIEKFSDLPRLTDEYARHIYKNQVKNQYLEEVFEAYDKNDEEVDHTKCVYDYPLFPDKFACEISTKTCDDNLTYSELFNKGADFKYLMADVSNMSDTNCDELRCLDSVNVLRNVFGYD